MWAHLLLQFVVVYTLEITTKYVEQGFLVLKIDVLTWCISCFCVYYHSRFNRPPWPKVGNKEADLLILRVDFTILPKSVDFTDLVDFTVDFTNLVDFTEVPVDFTGDFWSVRPIFPKINLSSVNFLK